ncbi:hypothetical protein [Daejeonella sp. H1SJ63]|uniref:hypothetical protein n=1 Tax=Daejeonella sp. H1SJ63 TaxID=3034145 RepID=UPI0023EB8AF6|nr:hypothetical protein [Daejeonella sp. H1SJ63]
MKQFAALALLLIILISFSCNSVTEKSKESSNPAGDLQSENDPFKAEDKLHEIILNLPEVKAKTNELRKINPDIRLVTMIQGYPEAQSPYYIVEFAEMQETHKVNIYWFYVHEKTFDIYLNDLVSDEIIPIESYRLKQKKSDL